MRRFAATSLAIASVASLALAAVACTPGNSAPSPQKGSPSATAPPSQAVAPSSSSPSPSSAAAIFGKKLGEDSPFVSLADLYKDPKSWDGKRVRTRGKVVAVCQAAGCWCDLRPEASPDDVAVPTHVTMHDHAFFLPKTSKSKVVDLEGVLAVRSLSEEEVAHYNSEGASLTAGTPMLNIDATGVVMQ